MPREPARNKEPRKEPTNFVARFRFSGQISNRATFFLPKCGFPTYFIPPNRLSRHFRATTGVCDVARFQKTAEKWNRATFRDTERAEAAGSMQPPQEKRIQADSPFFSIYFNALYQRGTKSPRNVTHLDEAGDVLLGYFNTIIYYAASEKLLWVRLFNLKNLYQQAAGNSSNTWNPAGDLRGPHPARLHPSRAIRHPSSTCT